MYSVAQKRKPLPYDHNIVLNRIKPVNEIILYLFDKLKYKSNTIILSVSVKCSMRDLLLD